MLENLGDPVCSFMMSYGICILSHVRGNPDTEIGQNLKDIDKGKFTQLKKEDD